MSKDVARHELGLLHYLRRHLGTRPYAVVAVVWSIMIETDRRISQGNRLETVSHRASERETAIITPVVQGCLLLTLSAEKPYQQSKTGDGRDTANSDAGDDTIAYPK